MCKNLCLNDSKNKQNSSRECKEMQFLHYGVMYCVADISTEVSMLIT